MAHVSKVQETVLITGGGGYFGHRLGVALNKKGINVILFDIRKPVHSLSAGMTFVEGDVRCLADLEKVLAGVSCVFHSASYGMSGREQFNRCLIEDVNLKGTANVIQSCIQQGVSRLVYTSTCNVVFGGQVILNGDESLPYLPQHLHLDHYSRTKALAEMNVLEANNTKLEGQVGVLRTCALRPVGIYGPGEQRHLPRVVNYLENGLFKFVYGDPSSLVEFVHVDNLISAHILASEALKGEKDHIAAGQSYFISDSRPVNSFEFFRPFVEGLGYTVPTLRLPMCLVYFFAYLSEIVHSLVSRFYNFQPLFTCTEVYKMGVTHYFSMEKAKKELGYQAQTYSLHEAVECFKHLGHGRKEPENNQNNVTWNKIFVALLALMLLAWLLQQSLPNSTASPLNYFEVL
ncbi:short-chain dehydrogenase/reductase family 42E member 1-like [Lissotriton helveticus]